MTDTPNSDTNTTDESSTDNTHRTAVRGRIAALLQRVRRGLAHPTGTTAGRQPPVLVADGGQSDAKIIGHNTDSSGQTVGVWGEVDSSDGCGLATPDDARIDGRLVTDAFKVLMDGKSTLAHFPDQSSGRAGNVIMGHSSNYASDGLAFPEGATISGGGYDDGSTAYTNRVHDHFGTVSGGRNNQAGSLDDDLTTAEYATVSGGRNNTASGEYATVGGGEINVASGDNSTVGGGTTNSTSGYSATVSGGIFNTAGGAGATVPGGGRGAAEDAVSFVWNDNSRYHSLPTVFDGLSSSTAVDGEPVTGENTFSVSAQGGVRFITGSSSVTYIDGGSVGWSNTSSRTAKTNIDPVDPQRVLAGVDDLEVATWEYQDVDKDGDGHGTRHIGPMAEEFHEILDVDVGSSDEHINSINADGVLFAAIQGLSAQLDKKDDRIADLERENEHLRDRLATIEAHLGLSEAEPDASLADD